MADMCALIDSVYGKGKCMDNLLHIQLQEYARDVTKIDGVLTCLQIA